MTEEEAKTKWCPHSMTLESYAETAAFNRNTNGQFVGNCIGSECMAWRSINSKLTPKHEGYSPKPQGYCGLAGKP